MDKEFTMAWLGIFSIMISFIFTILYKIEWYAIGGIVISALSLLCIYIKGPEGSEENE